MTAYINTFDKLETEKITIEATEYKNPGNLCRVIYYEYTEANNKIFIEEGVVLSNVQIEFSGQCQNAIVYFGKGSRIRGNFTVSSNCSIYIGDDTNMTRHSQVVAKESSSIKIGRECLISNTTILSTDHHGIYDKSSGERINFSSSVTIGSRVWLGQDVLVLKGVSIGDGAIIGARASVVKSIGKDCLAIGVPARVIRENVVWTLNMKDKL